MRGSNATRDFEPLPDEHRKLRAIATHYYGIYTKGTASNLKKQLRQKRDERLNQLIREVR